MASVGGVPLVGISGAWYYTHHIYNTILKNNRFQNKEYAPIEIVQTEMKGYGLRAEEFLHK